MVFASGSTILGWPGLQQALIVETAGQTQATLAVGLTATLTQEGVVGSPPLFGLLVDLTESNQAAWLSVGGISFSGALLAAIHAKSEIGTARRTSATSRPA